MQRVAPCWLESACTESSEHQGAAGVYTTGLSSLPVNTAGSGPNAASTGGQFDNLQQLHDQDCDAGVDEDTAGQDRSDVQLELNI